MPDALAFLEGLPEPWVYTVLGLGAALENVLPIIPADTFVLVGGFLAGLGSGRAPLMFLATWLLNVAGALGVYWAGLRFGERFFTEGRGRHLISPGQLSRLNRFYSRWGVMAIFLARFLPGFRAVVPVFAGVARQAPWRVAPPLIAASATWYGALVWAGWAAGTNLDEIQRLLRRLNLGFLLVSAVLFVLVGIYWWRTREGAATSSGGVQ